MPKGTHKDTTEDKAEDKAEDTTGAGASASLVVDELDDAQLSDNKVGRPRIKQYRRSVAKKLRETQAIDKVWLMEQLLSVYSARGIRAQDRLRSLELMARISGYTGKDIEPEDEQKAIAELMREMEKLG